MRLRALLESDQLGLRLLWGREELDRPVRGVMTTDLRDPSRYLHGDELVLTGLAWWRGAADAEPFVRLLAAAGVAGLAAGTAEFGSVPDELATACARHRLPLFAVAEEVGFADLTEHVVRQVSVERAGDLAAVVARHRRLTSAGGGPRAVLALLGSDLDLPAWLLTATGRPVADSGAGPLPAGVGAELAARRLAAGGAPPGPQRVALPAGGPGGGVYSLFPVPGEGLVPGPGAGSPADRRPALLADWLLAVRADTGDWPAERLALLDGVAGLVAVERDRREAARGVRRRLAQQVLELLTTSAPAAEVAARLRVAAPVLLPGRAGQDWQLVVARLSWPDAGFDTGPTARAVLEELLGDPTEPDAEVAVAHADGEAVALLPVCPLAEAGTPGAPVRAETLESAARHPLTAGLGTGGRLTLGVSSAVPEAEGLRGALREARHARRLAAARTEPVAVAGHDQLASHMVLLPFVPEDVRGAFSERLLDPLREYDRRHRAQLLPTLEAFLAEDGSWTRCAARLHLHVNTLRYRIGRIEQLTGRDLGRLEDAVDFLLALRLG
ncbi:PucR family transcriptional regulator ligand-binding domain-containing protein [Streptomyces sp. DSM 44915]|uniref:PucR family transcriptional regulator ligand-binding domain-containing protein n=1 Tax=Streptomyces chisholmiae TaxID=3075540 RepID=A0ABU2JNN7_9ACTN|nr:PucR family transcriptional regulator ligand-binding domain-containing protein [Streptomyces sp. DSM 44915]MDT0266334.1 PucR family transcriptional regulator ligand-binding domain-containing protein [Streptomyces sp. DSM 44915]